MCLNGFWFCVQSMNNNLPTFIMNVCKMSTFFLERMKKNTQMGETIDSTSAEKQQTVSLVSKDTPKFTECTENLLFRCNVCASDMLWNTKMNNDFERITWISQMSRLGTSKHSRTFHHCKCHVTNIKTADFNPVLIFRFWFPVLCLVRMNLLGFIWFYDTFDMNYSIL